MTEADTASRASATLETAPTRYIESSGIRFAYAVSARRPERR